MTSFNDSTAEMDSAGPRSRLTGVSSLPSTLSSEGYKSDEEVLDVSAIRALGPVLDQLVQASSGAEVLGFQMTKVLLNELVSFYDASKSFDSSKVTVGFYLGAW